MFLDSVVSRPLGTSSEGMEPNGLGDEASKILYPSGSFAPLIPVTVYCPVPMESVSACGQEVGESDKILI